MLVALKGPAARYSGFGKFFTGLVRRLQGRFPLEALAINNHVAEGCPIDIEPAPKAKWFGVLLGDPPYLDQLNTRYKILFTMYEHSDIPVEWQDNVRRANEVWVPSQFCAEVFGPYNPRVRVVPIGYDETVFNRIPQAPGASRAFWSLTCPQLESKRVIGIAGVLSKRKGVDVLVKAFHRAALDDTSLVLKTRDTRGLLPPLPPNTYVIDADWPDGTMAAFYRALDLFVMPTRGEGLGLPPLEAVACGTPSLVTRASGPCEYIDDRGVYGIDTTGYRRSEGSQAANVFWYEPDESDLVAKLRGMVYDPPVVEHRYRQHSMAFVADKWEHELTAARRRAEEWMRQH